MGERSWLPQGAPRAAVQLVHGMCEHIGRYDAFARRLADRGYAVFARDLPGHGEDCATPGYTPGNMWEDSLNVIRRDHEALRSRYPGIPAVVFGHSYGSFLTQRLVPELGADAYILSGSSRHSDTEKLTRLSALAQTLPPEEPAQKLAELTFVAYNGKFQAEGTNAWLTRDPQQVEKYNRDPHCGFVASGNFYRGMYGGLLGLCEPDFPPCAAAPVPVLIMSGDMDPVGGYGEGVRALAQLYGRQGYAVTLQLYPQGRHEMLNETNRDRVIEDVLRFLDEST